MEQLKAGGRMIIPVGTTRQGLLVLEKTAEGMREISDLPVRFVPMVKSGETEGKPESAERKSSR